MKKQVMLIIFSLFFSGIAWSEEETSEKDNGRYQIFFGKFKAADTFMVDTQTGKVWHLMKYSNVKNNPLVWLYQDRIDSQEERIKWESKQEFSTEAIEELKLQKAIEVSRKLRQSLE